MCRNPPPAPERCATCETCEIGSTRSSGPKFRNLELPTSYLRVARQSRSSCSDFYWVRIAFGSGAEVFLLLRDWRAMITPDVLTEYLLQMMPDAAVTVSDRTGTMDHLKVVVISAAFAGKNLLDRHRLIYQALDVPLKDGRIHALELTARTSDEL